VRRRGLQTVQEKADLQSHGPGFGNKFGNKHDKKSSLQINSTAGKPLKTEPFSYLNRNRQVIGSSPIVGSILPGVSWCTQLDLGRLIDAIELYQPSELLRLTPGMPGCN